MSQTVIAQVARKAKQGKGPRALGLLELSSDGKARLIPIAIMVDGKFYDAAAYKASPVPLALTGETVYEAERNGVSQGLFTVGDAIKAGSSWFADGKWRPAGSEPKKHVAAKPKLEEDEGPPRLRRPDSEKPQKPPADAKTPAATPAPSQPPPTTSTTPSAPPADATPKTAPPDAKPDDPIGQLNTAANDEDPNRPVLERGKIETLGSAERREAASGVSKKGAIPASTKPGATPSPSAKPATASKTTQLIPAISDAGGPDPRPYAYDLKPNEETKIRQQMLAMAADAITAKARPGSVPAPASKTATRPGTPAHHPAKGAQPTFSDVQFRAFDLWNTNEPVFVLTAKAQMPKTTGAPGNANELPADFTYYVTLVVKQDIYADLRPLNTTVTDTLHLDETPRLELIDAVDADGDGRGELLFRQISDAGTAWAVYRAGADQLFPLFEGTP